MAWPSRIDWALVLPLAACCSSHHAVDLYNSLFEGKRAALQPADEFGYISTSNLLVNYRLMQKRVDLSNLPKSKVLRKPLNVEDAQEDGHQGGRRYTPTDEGYLLLKRWVDNQPVVQKRKE
jgi:hypothetical protein